MQSHHSKIGTLAVWGGKLCADGFIACKAIDSGDCNIGRKTLSKGDEWACYLCHLARSQILAYGRLVDRNGRKPILVPVPDDDSTCLVFTWISSVKVFLHLFVLWRLLLHLLLRLTWVFFVIRLLLEWLDRVSIRQFLRQHKRILWLLPVALLLGMDWLQGLLGSACSWDIALASIGLGFEDFDWWLLTSCAWFDLGLLILIINFDHLLPEIVFL